MDFLKCVGKLGREAFQSPRIGLTILLSLSLWTLHNYFSIFFFFPHYMEQDGLELRYPFSMQQSRGAWSRVFLLPQVSQALIIPPAHCAPINQFTLVGKNSIGKNSCSERTASFRILPFCFPSLKARDFFLIFNMENRLCSWK